MLGSCAGECDCVRGREGSDCALPGILLPHGTTGSSESGLCSDQLSLVIDINLHHPEIYCKMLTLLSIEHTHAHMFKL